MIVNGKFLLEAAPIKGMIPEKRREHGVSYGLSEAGYDIRVKQTIVFEQDETCGWVSFVAGSIEFSNFALASSVEEFDMPDNLLGIVHDKSTLARQGVSVFNTVIEPGWKGFLTLEISYHGSKDLVIPAGAGIAQVIFHQTLEERPYTGKYQNQSDKPIAARFSDE